MNLRVAVLILAFSGLGRTAGYAGEKVWVGLYLAENEPPPVDAVLAPQKLHHQLHEVFGFKYYVLMKGQDVELHHEWEQWFVPRNDFFIRLEQVRRKDDDDERLIGYEIYKDGFIVAKGSYEPREGIPLFINGPDFHQGRLILVLDRR